MSGECFTALPLSYDSESEVVSVRIPREIYRALSEKADVLSGGDIPGMIVLILRRELMPEQFE
uniref:Uncharacterized protein n=1 Tax=viral metagenome TaxID=1070528 RepID=A0A6M3JGB8_9ZZZZ